ncbi:hypothetical protein 7865G3B6_26 [Haloquadratum phage sp.]|nr:hypothetical protein 7865G3B6_26 [Haloquadratum phage sp.]
MNELTQSERATIDNQHEGLEAHIMSKVDSSDKKISDIFSGRYTPFLKNNEVMVYLDDRLYNYQRTEIINAAMHHPHMNIRLSAMSDFSAEGDDSSAFLVFETPGIDQ